MGLFGRKKDEVWCQLCQETGAEFIRAGCRKGSKVQAHVGPWTITLDTYTVSEVPYTRMRAPYLNPEGFRFTIYRKGLFSKFGKLLGMQDIEVGDVELDEAFIIKATDEWKVRELLSNPKVRQMLQEQPRIRLEVKDSAAWFGPRFPEHVNELYFQVAGVVKDIDLLKGLFELFAAVLDQLCHIGLASRWSLQERPRPIR
jgi:hypothetical protein